MLQKYIPFYRRNLKVAFPIVLSQLGGAVVQLVDTFMVGKLGTAELASVSFASSVFVIGFIIANGLMMGITPLVGMVYVNKKGNQLISFFQNSFLLALFSAIILVLLFWGVTIFFPYMGQDVEVIRLARPYYIAILLSLIPWIFFLSFKQFFEGMGNTRVAMGISIVSNVLNIVFNYLFIFGACGFPCLGVLGAGVSTLISRLSMPILFLIYVRLKPTWWDFFKHFSWSIFSFSTIKKLLSVGFPIAGQMLLEVSAFALSCIMAGWIGASALAGHQITQNMATMTFMVVVGVASATTIRISHQYGIGDYAAVRMAVKASIHLCLLWNSLAAFLMIFFRTEIAATFSSDPIVIDLASSLLIFAGIFQLSDGLQSVGIGALRGLTDVKLPMLYAFISYICINLPLGYVLTFVFDMGVKGIWIAFIFGLSFAALLFHLRYYHIMARIEKSHQ